MAGSAVKTKHVAITGTATTTLLQAPWSDMSVELWALPALHRLEPRLSGRVNLWFELHPLSHARKFPWWEWALERQPPVMMQEACPELKRSRAYPLEAVEKMFGRYFTSSISFMIAFAIGYGAKEISLFGIDMKDADEYAHQRSCAEYLIGFAKGLGIKVNIPDHSDLLKSDYTYGYDFGSYERTPTAQDLVQHELADWRSRAIEAEARLVGPSHFRETAMLIELREWADRAIEAEGKLKANSNGRETALLV